MQNVKLEAARAAREKINKSTKRKNSGQMKICSDLFSSAERNEKTSLEFQHACCTTHLKSSGMEDRVWPTFQWPHPPSTPLSLPLHTHTHTHTQSGCVPGQWGRCCLLWREITSASTIRQSISTKRLQKVLLGFKHQTDVRNQSKELNSGATQNKF